MSTSTDETEGGAPVAARLGPSDGDSSGSRMSFLWIALAILAIAIASALGGIAVDRSMHAHGFGGWTRGGGRGGMGGPFGRAPSDSARKHMRERMAKELELTPAQATAVDSLMTAQEPKFRALREKLAPAMDSLVTETQVGMDRILTPAQREKSKAMRERMRGRHGPPNAP